MQDPQFLAQIGLQEIFKKRLKPNSVPDIPFLTEDEHSSNVLNQAKDRGAYSKRQKAEVCGFFCLSVFFNYQIDLDSWNNFKFCKF